MLPANHSAETVPFRATAGHLNLLFIHRAGLLRLTKGFGCAAARDVSRMEIERKLCLYSTFGFKTDLGYGWELDPGRSEVKASSGLFFYQSLSYLGLSNIGRGGFGESRNVSGESFEPRADI